MRMRISVLILMWLFAVVGCSKSQSTDELIEDLNSADAGDRVNAVRLLQHRQGDSAKVVPALIEMLKEEPINLRLSAAIGLGYYGADAEEAIPALEKAKNDPNAQIREAARVAISRIQGGDK